ncbi:MAG: NADH-quinone oxidoreductase subunit NuoE [Oscillospiraceae bacterium]|nr:NADH-quinone oxidoreductase subunit NuoE [Oscillospiraceae bacterium]
MPCECRERADLSLIADQIEKAKSAPGSLIPVLQAAQEAYGWLSPALLATVAQALEIPPAKVLGVASFYSQFRLSPVGKHLILLCQGTACHVNGSKGLEEEISAFLKIKDGETTADGLFTLKNVACLGCCSLSPVMMLNGEVHGNLTKEKVRKILEQLTVDG